MGIITMTFHAEPGQYHKTILSELQGAWENLRGSVVEQAGFPNLERLLFHINEAMSWESVRNLEKMKQALLLIQNIASQSQIPQDIQECMETVREDMDEVLSLIAQGIRL